VTSARALLRWQLQMAHDLLDGAVRPLSAEEVGRRPPGRTARAAACYAQVLLAEDLSVNGVLAAGRPLALSTFAGRTGLSELPPLAEPAGWQAWSLRVRLDLARLRPYAGAVSAATDAYVAGLPDEAFEPVPECLLTALLLTLSMRRGEIACLLGCPTPPVTTSAAGR
jgi:hypothetical protein